MPRTAIDYSNTIFYKIVCRDPEITDFYVGHTTNFVKRKYVHKHTCINVNSTGYNYIVYQFIRENGGWGNWDMIMIETCECENSIDACKKERQWIEELKPTLNKYRAYISADERKAQCNERVKNYIKKNREKYIEYQRNYYKKKREKHLLTNIADEIN
jgi:hypothetical protein